MRFQSFPLPAWPNRDLLQMILFFGSSLSIYTGGSLYEQMQNDM